MRRRLVSILSLVIVMVLGGHEFTITSVRSNEHLQDYPIKNVPIVEPFGVGGGPDLRD
jgi:hypothetical protein